MSRLVVVPDRSPESPVARTRAHGFASELARRGIASHVFTNTIPVRLSGQKGLRVRAARGAAGLMLQIPSIGRGDVLYLVRVQQIPIFPFAAIAWARAAGAKVVFDFDDAVFLQQPLATRWISKLADHVVVASDALVPYVERLGKPCTVVPTPFEPAGYPPPAPDPEPVIGWMGTPSNLPFLADIRDVLEEVMTQTRAAFRVVTRPLSAAKPHVPRQTEFVEWRSETYRQEVARFHVGVAPLPDSPWNRGKLGYKVIEYQACGVPVVAGRVMAKGDVLAEGVTGYYAESAEEWRQALLRILCEPDLRAGMAARARAHAESRFSLRVAGERLAPLIEELLAGRSRA